MPEVLKPDLCVIGAGPAGMALATAAVAKGISVVLIERGATGGAILNAGGGASKAMVAAARAAHFCQNAGRFGFKEGRGKVEFLSAHAHVRDTMRAMAPNSSRERIIALGVKVIAGLASFKDKDSVVVGNAYEIAAKRFVIATGAVDAPSSVSGLADVPHYTSETIFDLIHCPRHLIILAHSAYALEQAQAHRRFGAEVTVLASKPPLAEFDPEFTSIVLDQLTREGVAVRVADTILRIERDRPRVRVIMASEGAETEIEGSHLLVMPDRVGNFAELNLAGAGVSHDADGIVVNKRLRSSNGKVFAIGDVISGSSRSVAAAIHQADLIIRDLAGLAVDRSAAPIASVVHTDPELAHIGLGQEGLKKHRDLQYLRLGFADSDRARAEDIRQGHIKVVVDSRGRILSVTIVGPQATEMIALWSLALTQKLNIRDMRKFVAPYPSMTEISQRVAMGYDGPAETPSRVRRLLNRLRRS
jgi:pyruvate/2-oxoglutarate dehydrogenase complex dihydrolipoamide dehydrogenase (E3) component